MARYTVELNDIAKSGLKIFNFEYEFYEPTKKSEFENKFFNHFRFREIGVETVGRFQHYLKCKCDETLPYYNMLFRTALIDYEKTINYNLTETFTKDNTKKNDITGNATIDGTATDTTTTNNTLNRTADIIATGEKSNTLNSETNHTNNTTFNKDETLTEENTIDKISTKDTDNKKVESDTPSGLLSMSDIKSNIYASKVNIDDNIEKIVDKDTTKASKKDKNTETTNDITKDIISANSHDSSTDTNNEDTTETNNGTTTNNGNFGNTTNTTQNATATENENYTKILKGSYGVITEADMLQKHIALQQTLSTIYVKFFDDCEDLFMQIYE